MPPKPKTKNETKAGAAALPASKAPAAAAVAPSAVTDYEEIQKFEIEALQAIYMDDFKEVQMKPGAWNVRASLELF